MPWPIDNFSKFDLDNLSSYVICEYIWLDSEFNIRSKTKNIKISSLLDKQKTSCLEFEEVKAMHENIKEFILKCCSTNVFPSWNYDGSSTGQTINDNTEVILTPCNHYKHPFSNYDFLILCDIMNPEFPDFFDFRRQAVRLFQKYKNENYWIGLEQEYFIMDSNSLRPIGYDNIIKSNPSIQQGEFYCGNNGRLNHGRLISERHNRACLDIGIIISGINAEVAVGQWEYQIGPCSPLKSCDDLIVSRFILNRIAEEFGYYISFEPKIMEDWNGSGCHINISSFKMRTNTKDAYDEILKAITNLSNNHKETIKYYGSNNCLRMTGIHETSSYDKFTYGVGTRNTSVRIGNDTFENKYGYFEDRRPGSNINPYSALFAIIRDMNSSD